MKLTCGGFRIDVEVLVAATVLRAISSVGYFVGYSWENQITIQKRYGASLQRSRRCWNGHFGQGSILDYFFTLARARIISSPNVYKVVVVRQQDIGFSHFDQQLHLGEDH